MHSVIYTIIIFVIAFHGYILLIFYILINILYYYYYYYYHTISGIDDSKFQDVIDGNVTIHSYLHIYIYIYIYITDLLNEWLTDSTINEWLIYMNVNIYYSRCICMYVCMYVCMYMQEWMRMTGRLLDKWTENVEQRTKQWKRWDDMTWCILHVLAVLHIFILCCYVHIYSLRGICITYNWNAEWQRRRYKPQMVQLCISNYSYTSIHTHISTLICIYGCNIL